MVYEELGRLKRELVSLKEINLIKDNVPLKEKIEKVYNVLSEFEKASVDPEIIETILNAQQVLQEIQEIEEDDN